MRLFHRMKAGMGYFLRSARRSDGQSIKEIPSQLHSMLDILYLAEMQLTRHFELYKPPLSMRAEGGAFPPLNWAEFHGIIWSLGRRRRADMCREQKRLGSWLYKTVVGETIGKIGVVGGAKATLNIDGKFVFPPEGKICRTRIGRKAEYFFFLLRWSLL